jgi:hypothetical protein
VPPDLIGPPRQCPCNAFQIDFFGDHLQTCQAKSAGTQVHDWVVYRLGGILGSVVHRVKIHKITPVQGKERGDVEIRDYVVFQKPRDGTDCLPPPRTLILDLAMCAVVVSKTSWKDRNHRILRGVIAPQRFFFFEKIMNFLDF